MTWIIIFIIVGVVVFFISAAMSPEQNDKKARTKTPSNTNIQSVSELVNEVKTLDDLKKLKQKYLRSEQSYMNNMTDNPNIEKRYRSYEDAYWKATDKTLFYQYEPELNLETPISILENAFKIFPVAEYKTAREKIGGEDRDWIEISGSDYEDKNYETKPTYFDALIEFQNIISSQKNIEEKVEELNELGKKKRILKKEFFYDEKEPLGVLWMKQLLSSFKIPLLDKLYDLGYSTPSKLINADIKEIEQISGFGAKKIEDFKLAIEKLKDTF